MKKILIIYNSGAGSTKTVAQIYQTLLSECEVDILPASLSFDFSMLNHYDLLIFAFPCYHNDISPFMYQFMKIMPKQTKKKKAFAFITYGLYAGNTLRTFISECVKKNIYIEDYADYRAPATDASLIFPPFKFIYSYERKIGKSIAKDINKVRSILLTKNPSYKLPRYKLYSILNYPHEKWGKKLKPQIKVRKETCTNCHLCVNSCPRRCWTIGDSYPVFNKSECETCYKCIHQCPAEAIILSKRTIKKKKMNTSFYKKWKDKILQEIKNLD